LVYRWRYVCFFGNDYFLAKVNGGKLEINFLYK
jgi:hypothetical protein